MAYRDEGESVAERKSERSKQKQRGERLKSILLNVFTFGLAIVVIVASFRTSDRGPGRPVPGEDLEVLDAPDRGSGPSPAVGPDTTLTGIG